MTPAVMLAVSHVVSLHSISCSWKQSFDSLFTAVLLNSFVVFLPSGPVVVLISHTVPFSFSFSMLLSVVISFLWGGCSPNGFFLFFNSHVSVHPSLADPGGPSRGRHQHTDFLKNCIKLRKFWSVGGHPQCPPWIRHCPCSLVEFLCFLCPCLLIDILLFYYYYIVWIWSRAVGSGLL